MIVRELIDAYVTDAARRGAYNGGASITSHFITWRDMFGEMDAKELRNTHALLLASRREREGISVATINKEIFQMRTALKWGQQRDFIELIPYLRTAGETPKRNRALSVEDECRKLLLALDPKKRGNKWHTTLFALLTMFTAKSKGPILNLTWGDINFKKGVINFDNHGCSQTRRVPVPISPLLGSILEYAKGRSDGDDCSSVISFRGEPVKDIRTSFQSLCRRAGLKDVRPQDLKMAAAKWDLNSEAADLVRKIIGKDLIGWE